MADSDEPKPCPFCGETSEGEGGEEMGLCMNNTFLNVMLYYILCGACGAEGPDSPDADVALKLWNKRK